MGMSNVASHLIMFIAILSISTMLVSVFNQQMDNTASSIVVQQNYLAQQLKTDISIEVVNYVNGTENQTTVYLENTGATILDIDMIDLYIGGERIARNTTERIITMLSDTDFTNIGHWDPKEQVKIVVNRTLQENMTYKLVVTSQYGATANEDFST
jgi:archaellum component FlaG (FlaF/FlaG flagellin family)